MSHFWKFRAMKQKTGTINKGKWAVYRPDEIRLVVCGSQKEANSIAWALNYAAQQFEAEGNGDWRSLLGKGQE